MNIKLIHADDDELELEKVRKEVSACDENLSFEIESFNNTVDYCSRITSGEKPDAVLLDIQFDDEEVNGFDLIRKTRGRFSDVAIIVMSSRERVIAKALSEGANEFISKEHFDGELRSRIYRTVRELREKLGLLELVTGKSEGVCKNQPSIIGKTMQTIAQRVKNIANSAIETVLITGETGSGKELVVDLFEWELGGKKIVRVNCGEFAPDLIVSELFGSKKGAYTGAVYDRPGLVETANGGWLFLDEIHCLPLAGQTALLRLIDNKEFRRVGDNQYRPLNVKVLAATNVSLEKLVKEEKFKKDLLNRLVDSKIAVTPIRERKDEIRDIIYYFCQTLTGGPFEIDESLLQELECYNFENGNVREIRGLLRAMTENPTDKKLTARSMPQEMWKKLERISKNKAPKTLNVANGNQLLLDWERKERYDDLTDKLLLAMVRRINSDMGKISLRSMANEIGINRATLSERLKRMVKNSLLGADELFELSELRTQEKISC